MPNSRELVCILLLLATSPAAGEQISNHLFAQHGGIGLLIDPDNGDIVDANITASQFYGYTRNELKTLRIQDVNTLTEEQVAIERALAKEERRNYFLFRHRLANGDIRTVEVHSHPIAVDGRQLLYSIILDVTPRENLQNAAWHRPTLDPIIQTQTEQIRLQGSRNTWILSTLLLFMVLMSIFLWRSRQKVLRYQGELETERRRISDVLTGTNVGTWEWNIKTGETRFNNRWAEMIGYSLEELEPVSIDTWTKFAHPDDLKRSNELLEKHFRGESEFYECEARLQHKDGHWIWVLDRGKVHSWDEDGNPLMISGTHQDFTNYKNIELELIEKEALLKEAQSIAQLGNWELDPKTMKARWSDEVFQMLDVKCNDNVGPEFLSTLLHPTDREGVLASLQNAVNLNTEHHMEYRINRSNGETRWVECQAVHKYDEEGQLEALRGVIQDITARKLSELALAESEEWFKAITQQTTEGISVADPEGNYTLVNPAFCNMIGYSEAELLHMTVFDVKAPEQDHGSFEETKSSQEGLPVLEELQRKDGSTFIAQVIGKMISINGKSHVLGIVRDITEQVERDRQIRTLSLAIEQSPVSVLITDTDARIEYVNCAFERISGYKAHEVIGENPRIMQSGLTPRSVYKTMWDALTGGKSWQGEIQNRKKNGDFIWEFCHFAPVLNDAGETQHYLAVKEDITQRKLQEDKIIQQAHFDHLTGLPNRFLSLDRLSQLINEARRNNELVAVLFVDLDDFKKINDSLGHDTGDQLLVQASERLMSVVRSGDTVGRLGGDEFLILLGGLTDPAEALPIAENLLERFREAFRIDDRDLILTASVGIAVYPKDSDNASELLRNADSAMYHSKDLGRNTYSYFTQSMNKAVSRRLALEEQIHGALDRGEFSVLFQPQIEVSTGHIIGAEALLRWTNPVLGAVSPVEFIPIAEQTGLIVQIGDFVLEEALARTKNWQENFLADFRIAVNLSPRQFRNPKLIENLQSSIEKSGLNINSLELEITEGVLMTGYTYIDDALNRLNELGVNIAMDDFGTGYSSLSYLRSYPFHVLKIDRNFICDITVDASDRELISAAIAMAHALNLKVVAEGVETQEQLDFLKSLDCDVAQGYLFSKPISAEQMNEFIAQHPCQAN